jgi:hypothetical protein
VLAIAAAIAVPMAVNALYGAAAGVTSGMAAAEGMTFLQMSSALPAMGGMTAGTVATAAGGFAAGGIAGGNLNSAVQGALTSLAFSAVGDLANSHGLKAGDFGEASHINGMVGHAVVGCASSAAQGGSCKSGAASAAFAMFFTPHLSVLDGNTVGGTVAHAMLGGAGAVLGGGKFENGAVTGAFGYLFNQCVKGGCWVNERERSLAQAGQYAEFYKLSCKNGDAYACRAGEVSQSSGFMASATTFRLGLSLITDGIHVSPEAFSRALESIRIDLAKEYVNHLDLEGATQNSPKWPSRTGISKFHNEVFARHGAGRVFGGDTWDSYFNTQIIDNHSGQILYRPSYDWCPNCRK